MAAAAALSVTALLGGCAGMTIRFVPSDGYRSGPSTAVVREEPRRAPPPQEPSRGGGAVAQAPAPGNGSYGPRQPEDHRPQAPSKGGGAVAPGPANGPVDQGRPPREEPPRRPEPQPGPPPGEGKHHGEDAHQPPPRVERPPEDGRREPPPRIEQPPAPAGPPISVARLYPIRNNVTVRLENRHYQGRLFIQTNRVTILGEPGSTIDGELVINGNNFTLRGVTVNGNVIIRANNADLTGAQIRGSVDSQGNGNRW